MTEDDGAWLPTQLYPFDDDKLVALWGTLTADQRQFINLTTQLDGRNTLRVMREDGVPAEDCLKDEAPGLTYRQKQRRKNK